VREFRSFQTKWKTLTLNPEDDSLSAILIRVANCLPVEIASEIWQFLPPCYAHIMIAWRAYASIAASTQAAAAVGQFETINLTGEVTIYKTTVCNESYICGIQKGGKMYGYRGDTSEWTVYVSSIQAIAVEYGLYGVQKLRLLYGNDTDDEDDTDDENDTDEEIIGSPETKSLFTEVIKNPILKQVHLRTDVSL
jgi:hypothetical protein